MATVYKLDYDGQFELQRHDTNGDLRRWFDNYKVDDDCRFADDREWLTIEEKKFRGARRSGVRYVGTIGDVDELGPRRTVVFETNAPPPPTFHRPAKFKPERIAPRAHDSSTMTYDTIMEAMRKSGIPPKEFDRTARSRSFGLENEMRLLQRKLDEEAQQMFHVSTLNWLLPIRDGDRLISGLDIGKGDDMTTLTVVTPIPPPKRYRRNAK